MGINTVALNFIDNAKLLDEIKIGFEQGALTALPIEASMTYSPEQASQAYQQVITGSHGKRVMIQFCSE